MERHSLYDMQVGCQHRHSIHRQLCCVRRLCLLIHDQTGEQQAARGHRTCSAEAARQCNHETKVDVPDDLTLAGFGEVASVVSWSVHVLQVLLGAHV